MKTTKIMFRYPFIIPEMMIAFLLAACATQTASSERINIVLLSVETAKIKDDLFAPELNFEQTKQDGHIIRFEADQNMGLESFTDKNLSFILHYYQCTPDTGMEYLDTHNREYLPSASSVVARMQLGPAGKRLYESRVPAGRLSQISRPICAKFVAFDKQSKGKFSYPVFISNEIKLEALDFGGISVFDQVKN